VQSHNAQVISGCWRPKVAGQEVVKEQTQLNDAQGQPKRKIETTYMILDVPKEDCLHHLHFSPKPKGHGGAAAAEGSRPESCEALPEQEKCSGTILSHLLDISETDIWAEEELGEIKVEHVSGGAAQIGASASQNSKRSTTYTVYSFGDIT
jgi:hypothetical protein